jgi:hypothetical protein
MSQKILFKRGTKINLPMLNTGEPAFTTDTEDIYIGNGTSNIRIAKDSDINTVYITTNSGNAYTVTIPNIITLTDGHLFVIKFNAASTGAITLNVNTLGDVSILDYSGAAVTDVRLNLIVNLRYESVSNSFILQGKGGGGTSTGGTATAAQILAPATATVNSGQITGTITTKTAQTYTPNTVNQTIAAGQYLGDVQTILGDPDLVSANIKAGANIFGVAGKTSVVETSSATATAAQILSGKTGYVNGSLITGNIVDRTTMVSDASHAGLGDDAATTARFEALSTWLGTHSLFYNVPKGYYDTNVWLYKSDADYIASNILSTANIFGLAGTATVSSLGGKQMASGTATSAASSSSFAYISSGTAAAWPVTVTGLTFLPSIILIISKTAGNSWRTLYMSAGYSSNYAGSTVECFATNTGTLSMGTTAFRADTTHASVTSTGFILPFSVAQNACNWFAYE